MKLYQRIAQLLEAIENCWKNDNKEWEANHLATLHELTKTYLPSGSGLDSCPRLVEDDSTPEKLLFTSDFHHMDKHGGCSGWSYHSVIVRPSLAHGITIRITGRNRDGIKEYLYDLWNAVLTTDLPT